jgi:methionyl-tRNA formyltransferase
MKIACVSYRDWALKIYDELAASTAHKFLIIRSKEKYNEAAIRTFNPDFILFYGWSWIVKSDLLNHFKCLMLHPSPLPKYRGGSPIQNQIIAGEKKSMVTIFHMSEELDAGDILKQKEFSLEGDLTSIFERISKIGFEMTKEIFDKGFNPLPQDHSKATYCKRRKPEESEITLDEIKSKPAEYLYNKIRMLSDPYPNAYITTSDGKKIVIKIAEIE